VEAGAVQLSHVLLEQWLG